MHYIVRFIDRFKFTFQAQKLQGQPNSLQIQNKKLLKSLLANVKNSKVKQVKMPYSLQTPTTTLQKKVAETNIQVEVARRSLKNSQKTSVEGRAQEGAVEAMDNIVVENLIYNGKNPIFKGKVNLP
jgi:hypothetical protein